MPTLCWCGKGATYGIPGGVRARRNTGQSLEWTCWKHASPVVRQRFYSIWKPAPKPKPLKRVKLPRRIRLCHRCGAPGKARGGSRYYCTRDCARQSLLDRERERGKRDRIRDRLNGKTRDRYQRDRDRFIAKYGLAEWRRQNVQKQRRRMLQLQDRMKQRCKRRIHRALNGKRPSASTMDLIGCSIQHYINHIESQFVDGMSWSNYPLWHIDEIIPCCMFDLTQPEEQRRCFHYSNQRPLWAKDNLTRPKRGTHQPRLPL